MHDLLLMVLIFGSFLCLTWLCLKALALRFMLLCREQVQLAGGQVLRSEVRLLPKASLRFSNETQVIVQVEYRDATGVVRRLMGRTGLTVAAGGEQFVWEPAHSVPACPAQAVAGRPQRSVVVPFRPRSARGR